MYFKALMLCSFTKSCRTATNITRWSTLTMYLNNCFVVFSLLTVREHSSFNSIPSLATLLFCFLLCFIELPFDWVTSCDVVKCIHAVCCCCLQNWKKKICVVGNNNDNDSFCYDLELILAEWRKRSKAVMRNWKKMDRKAGELIALGR